MVRFVTNRAEGPSALPGATVVSNMRRLRPCADASAKRSKSESITLPHCREREAFPGHMRAAAVRVMSVGKRRPTVEMGAALASDSLTT